MCYFHCASREFLFSRCVWSLVNGEVLAPCDHVRKTEETQLSTGPGPGTNTTTLASLSLGHGSQHGARYDTITKHNYITTSYSLGQPSLHLPLKFDILWGVFWCIFLVEYAADNNDQWWCEAWTQVLNTARDGTRARPRAISKIILYKQVQGHVDAGRWFLHRQMRWCRYWQEHVGDMTHATNWPLTMERWSENVVDDFNFISQCIITVIEYNHHFSV